MSPSFPLLLLSAGDSDCLSHPPVPSFPLHLRPSWVSWDSSQKHIWMSSGELEPTNDALPCSVASNSCNKEGAFDSRIHHVGGVSLRDKYGGDGIFRVDSFFKFYFFNKGYSKSHGPSPRKGTVPSAPRARNLHVRLCLWLFCPASLVFCLASLCLAGPFASPSQTHKASQNNSQQNVSTHKCLGCRLLLLQLSGSLTILIFPERFDRPWCFSSTHETK